MQKWGNYRSCPGHLIEADEEIHNSHLSQCVKLEKVFKNKLHWLFADGCVDIFWMLGELHTKLKKSNQSNCVVHVADTRHQKTVFDVICELIETWWRECKVFVLSYFDCGCWRNNLSASLHRLLRCSSILTVNKHGKCLEHNLKVGLETLKCICWAMSSGQKRGCSFRVCQNLVKDVN